LRSIELASWHGGVAAVFQDFVRFELSLRDNVDPAREASDDDVTSPPSSTS
jgi:ATP-binding cassette, subfamily B, bacterial